MFTEIADFYIDESFETETFKLGTAGYIKDDGTYVVLDAYHGDDVNYKNLLLPEFSNTHPEEDTCVRIYKKPNEIQCKKLEEVIDEYLDKEGYCKVEIWDKPSSQYSFYKVYSLYEDACEDYSFEEEVGNWTGYKLVSIIKNQFTKNEQLLNEATRNEIIGKSEKADSYSDGKGNRWEARKNIGIANTTKDYNKIDMNTFWKDDILNFGVKVNGETDNYTVTVELNNIHKKLQKQVARNDNKLERDIVTKALMDVMNSSDVKFDCECPDWKFRLKYAATKNGYNAGTPERRPSDITNPDDTKGAACKHILAVINNLSWIRNIASVIVNYANYCKDNLTKSYERFIFPKIYGMSVNDAEREINDEKLATDEATINLSNALGKVRGRFKKKESEKAEEK